MSLNDFLIMGKLGKLQTDNHYKNLHKYIFIKGEGSYSEVFKVERINDRIQYALKKVKMN